MTHLQVVFREHGFFNPVPVMKLVEIIRPIATSDTVTAALGKTMVEAKDTPGLIVNRLRIPYPLEALRMFGERHSDARGYRRAHGAFGCGHRMGPPMLLDFVGLDTTYHIANIMFEVFKEPLLIADC